MAYEHLLSPIKIGTLTLRNRVVMGAMGSATANPDATVGECERAYFSERAKGGCGLIITEVTRVNHETAVMMPRQTSAAKDECIDGLRRLADDVHYYGGAIFCQLHHPGRQSFTEINGNIPLPTPSGIESPVTHAPCQAMSIIGIRRLIREFAEAAARCQEAGIDGVEVHCAHGYLLNQFLSPYTNRRTDDYGGSVLRRARIVKEIIEAIRAKVGRDYPVTMRISADEFLRESPFPLIGDNLMPETANGLLPEQAVEIVKYLVPFGLDAVSVSAGIYETENVSWEPVSYPEGWKIYLAELIKKVVDVPVFGVGVIRNPDFAEKLISEGRVDCVVIARGQLADPDWVKKASEGREREIRRCISCLNCFETLQTSAMTGEPVSCAVNARSGREWFYNGLVRDGEERRVVIVGGGPAGCEAARVLAERGFAVTLFEKGARLGGQLNMADKPPHKEKIDWLIEWFEYQLEKLGVDIRLNTPADVGAVRALDPYAVFVGTGSEPIVPRAISGSDGDNVYTTADILTGRVSLSGREVAVIGSGMTGLETSELLASQGNRVTIVEMAPSIGPDASHQNRLDVTRRLDKYDTVYLPAHKLVKINAGSVTLAKGNEGTEIDVPADCIILSLGVRAPQDAYNAMVETFGDRVHPIGDTKKIGRIASAVHSAFREAYRL